MSRLKIDDMKKRDDGCAAGSDMQKRDDGCAAGSTWTFTKKDLVVCGLLLLIVIVANVGLNVMSLDQGRGDWNLAARLEYKLVIDLAFLGIAGLGLWRNRTRQNQLFLVVILLYAIGDMLAPVALVPWSGIVYIAGHVLLICIVLKRCKPRVWQIVMFGIIVVCTVVIFAVFVRDRVDKPFLYALYMIAVSAKFAICAGYKPYLPGSAMFFVSDVTGFIRKAFFNVEPFHVATLIIYYIAILLYVGCMFYRESRTERYRMGCFKKASSK